MEPVRTESCSLAVVSCQSDTSGAAQGRGFRPGCRRFQQSETGPQDESKRALRGLPSASLKFKLAKELFLLGRHPRDRGPRLVCNLEVLLPGVQGSSLGLLQTCLVQPKAQCYSSHQSLN